MLEIGGGTDLIQLRDNDGKTCLHFCAEMRWMREHTKPKNAEAVEALRERRTEMEKV